MAEVTYVTKDGLDRVDARLTAEIKENKQHIKENSEAIVKLETLYGTLVKLPDAISALEKTVVSVNYNLETMSTRIGLMNESITEQRNSIKDLRAENQKQNETIHEVDNKSKIDWSKAITANFWKIILAIAGAIVAYKQLIG